MWRGLQEEDLLCRHAAAHASQFLAHELWHLSSKIYFMPYGQAVTCEVLSKLKLVFPRKVPLSSSCSLSLVHTEEHRQTLSKTTCLTVLGLGCLNTLRGIGNIGNKYNRKSYCATATVGMWRECQKWDRNQITLFIGQREKKQPSAHEQSGYLSLPVTLPLPLV